MSASPEAARKFFTYPSFAVVGASENPSKFGNIILNWYHERGLRVTPINPNSPSISVHSAHSPLLALPHIGALPAPWETALSIVTPPRATRQVLEEAKELGFPAVWLQPGTFDGEVLEYLQEANFEACVLGDGGAGGEGWCVLVDGRMALDAARFD